MINLPQAGTKQQALRDIDFVVHDCMEPWAANLEATLVDQGISSYSVSVAPGQAIILPPDQYYCIKQAFEVQEGKGVPLVGLACSSTFVGPTEESFSSHYESIKVRKSLKLMIAGAISNLQ